MRKFGVPEMAAKCSVSVLRLMEHRVRTVLETQLHIMVVTNGPMMVHSHMETAREMEVAPLYEGLPSAHNYLQIMRDMGAAAHLRRPNNRPHFNNIATWTLDLYYRESTSNLS